MTEQTISDEIPQINLSDPKQLADFARYVWHVMCFTIYIMIVPTFSIYLFNINIGNTSKITFCMNLIVVLVLRLHLKFNKPITKFKNSHSLFVNMFLFTKKWKLL